jgi:hypothetical protein
MESGRLFVVLLAIAATCVAPGRAEAQGSVTGGRPDHRGWALDIYAVGTNSFTVTAEGNSGGGIEDDGAGGLGLGLSYALRSNIALFVAADISIYGDAQGFSAYTFLAAGAKYRHHLTNRFVAALGGGVGHAKISEYSTFTVGFIDGGIEFFISRRLALGAGLQAVTPFNTGTRFDRPEPTSGTLSNLTRKRFGLHWYPGKRS